MNPDTPEPPCTCEDSSVGSTNCLVHNAQARAWAQEKEMMAKDEDDAFTLLKDPNLLENYVHEMDKVIPNQHMEKKMLILSLASALCEDCPEKLHIFINSDSSAGKSFLMKQFAKLLPASRTDYYTRISPKALAYLHPAETEPGWSWEGKHLFIEDIEQDLLDSDVFKVFATEGAKTVIVDKGKAKKISINGRPTIIITTAEARPKSETLNRFILLNLDESEAQTRAILLSIAKGEEIAGPWMAVFGILEPHSVQIPWIETIAKRFPVSKVRARRDFHRFRAMIAASTILHQYQREFDQEGRLIATTQDFSIAMSLFQFTNPGALAVDLTHVQRKAYEDLCALQRKCPLVSYHKKYATDTSIFTSENEAENLKPHLSIAQTCDAEGVYHGNYAGVCECGSAFFSRACISNHYGNRTMRQWDFLLERLMAKGVVFSRTLENPKTKRDVTVYFLKNIDIIDTFNIDTTTTTSCVGGVKKVTTGSVYFCDSTKREDDDGHVKTPISTVNTVTVNQTEPELTVDVIKMAKNEVGGASHAK